MWGSVTFFRQTFFLMTLNRNNVNSPTDNSPPDNWPTRQLIPFGYTPQGGPGGLPPGYGIENIAPYNMVVRSIRNPGDELSRGPSARGRIDAVVVAE